MAFDASSATPISDARPRTPPLVTALSVLVGRNLATVAAVLCLLFAGLAVSHRLFEPAPVAEVMMPVAGISAALLGGLWWWLRRQTVPAAAAYPVLLGMVLVLDTNGLLHMYLAAEPRQTTNLILPMVGAGFFILSHHWFVLAMGITVGAWLGVVVLLGHDEAWLHFGFLMLMATVGATLIHLVQVRILRRLVTLRAHARHQNRRLRTELRASQNLEQALRDSEERFRGITNAALVGIYVIQAAQFRYVNPAMADLFGYRPQDMIGKLSPAETVVPAQRDLVRRKLAERLDGVPGKPLELRCVRRDGSYFDAMIRSALVYEHGQPALVGTMVDISALKRAQAELATVNARLEDQIRHRTRDLEAANAALRAEIGERRQTEEQLRLWERVAAASSNGIVITNPNEPDNPIVSVNPAFEWITGYGADEVLGRNCRLLQGDDRNQPSLAELRQAVTRHLECQVLLRNYRKDGALFWNELFIAPVWDDAGRLSHYIGVINDITQQKAYEARLRRQASFDALTGLANRNVLQDRLRHAIAHARRNANLVAVLFLDLDRFKLINDSLGHAAGDNLLRAVARRLEAVVRAQDTVARLGGDEFVLLLEDLDQESQAIVVARKVLDTLRRPFDLEEQGFVVTTSVGISFFPKDGEDLDTLLRNADTALHRAKEHSRNTLQCYSAEMNLQVKARLTQENELRQALARDALTLHYQPQVSLKDGRTVGLEALLRWQHPQLGLLPPGQFLATAEESGLIVPMGNWVLRRVCEQLCRWREQGLTPLPVGVNLSTRQFIQAGLVERIRDILADTGVEPGWLELEITESLLLKDITAAVDTLTALRDMGLRIAIDDFGTGYSSLAYLKRLPIHRLKVAQAFVADISHDPDDAAITRTVIAMAHQLKLRVMAEGVETREQLDFLRDSNCDEAQGYYFAAPQASETLDPWLSRRTQPLGLE